MRKTFQQNVSLTLSQLGTIYLCFKTFHLIGGKKKIYVLLEIFDFHVFAALG